MRSLHDPGTTHAQLHGRRAQLYGQLPLFAFFAKPHTAACAVRFHDVFEAVYSAPALQNLPFRVTSGNHDHHGNVSAQIAYTNLSSRWYYPDWFYSWKRSYTDKASGNVVTVEVAMIDTVILTAAFELNDTVVGPPPEAQWAWLEGVLDSSSADYLWVGGQ